MTIDERQVPQGLPEDLSDLLSEVRHAECPFTGVVHWRQLMAGSGGSQGFPAMALLMASSAVMP